jgi:hypothetical protein
MEYSDEKWKCGSPSLPDFCGYYTDVQPDCFSNEEWYGIMATEDNGSQPDIMHPRKVYCALQQAFSSREFSSDFDIDGKVNFYDFAAFASHWLQINCYENNCCGSADFDCSNAVDNNDLAVLAEEWLEGV